MASMIGQFVAVAYAIIAVIIGSLVGGNSFEDTLDLANAVACIGGGTILFNEFTREIVVMLNRFGGAVLFNVALMG